MRRTDKDEIRATDSNHDGTANGGRAFHLEDRLAKAASTVYPSRHRLVTQILDNSEDTYFLSSRELAKRFDVDAATIVRTIQVLDYERYADFLVDLRADFVLRISPYTVMKAAARQKHTISDYVEHSLEMEAHNLDKLRWSLRRKMGSRRRAASVARGTSWWWEFIWLPAVPLLSYSLASLGFDSEAPVGSAGKLPEGSPPGPAYHDRDQFWSLSERNC